MFSGLLFHTLKGIRGWSWCVHTKIDVAKIMSVQYEKRAFKLWDRDHDYSLRIQYKEGYQSFSVNPVIGGRGGVTVTPKYSESRCIVKRYKTLSAVNQEINEIVRKQTKLESYRESYQTKMREHIKNM